MRKQYFRWMFIVGGIVCFSYGLFTLIYHFNHGNGLNIPSLLFLIVGALALITYGVLYLISLCEKKKKAQIKEEEKIEPIVVEQVEEKPEPVKTTKEETPVIKTERKRDYTYTRSSSRDYDTDAYVKLVGYGPVLRVNGNRIIDMRSNTYYRIQGNMVYQDGSGPVFEINGNRIKLAFGGYLYEISGSNINKTFGGFYASISGGYITTHDLKEKYEITDSLNIKQQLAVVALLFGQY